MRAVYAEFELESSTMNTREFYASRQGTQKYLTKDSLACALTYSESLQRNKGEAWTPLLFPFECTPAAPVDVRIFDTIYKAGDDPNRGLLRFGHQELLMPGSLFRFVVWGEPPPIWTGQILLIGKKRAAARIITCVSAEVEPNTTDLSNHVMSIQVMPGELSALVPYSPIILTARYAIVQLPLRPALRRFIVGNWLVPLI